MAIVNSLQKITLGFGASAVVVNKASVTNATNATTTTTFTNAQLNAIAPDIMCGYVRIKTLTTGATAYPGAGAGVCSAIKISVSDGTSTIVIANVPTFAASDLFDLTFPFMCDLAAGATIAFAVTMTNVANGQLVTDMEVAIQA